MCGGIMKDERLKELAYIPILEAWKVIHMVQNLDPAGDDEGWRRYCEEHEKFCRIYNPEGKTNTYGYHLGMAIIEIVDTIKDENRHEV